MQGFRRRGRRRGRKNLKVERQCAKDQGKEREQGKLHSAVNGLLTLNSNMIHQLNEHDAGDPTAKRESETGSEAERAGGFLPNM